MARPPAHTRKRSARGLRSLKYLGKQKGMTEQTAIKKAHGLKLKVLTEAVDGRGQIKKIMASLTLADAEIFLAEALLEKRGRKPLATPSVQGRDYGPVLVKLDHVLAALKQVTDELARMR